VFVCASACESVREHISGTACAIFTDFVHVTYGRGSVSFRRRCDTLFTSGFVDTVMRIKAVNRRREKGAYY